MAGSSRALKKRTVLWVSVVRMAEIIGRMPSTEQVISVNIQRPRQVIR